MTGNNAANVLSGLAGNDVLEPLGHVDLERARIELVDDRLHDGVDGQRHAHVRDGLVVVGESEELGVDDGGVDDVHFDPGVGEVDRHPLGPRRERGLRRRVRRLGAGPQACRNGGDVDDPAAPVDQPGQECQRQADRRA